jgi:uncharacterized membrane protein
VIESNDDSRITVAIQRTFAVTLALPFSVNVHVFLLAPPLEQAPDQITSRSFVARSVIELPTVNDADPVLPTATLMPAGVEIARVCQRGVSRDAGGCTRDAKIVTAHVTPLTPG